MKAIKRMIPVLLCFVFAASSFWTVSAWAAATEAAEQDGLAASLTCDKTEYRANEKVGMTLTVKNNNPYAVEGVQTEIILPDGMKIESESLTQDTFALSSGESKVQEVRLTSVSADLPASESPKTGDNAFVGLNIVLMLLSGGTLIFIGIKQNWFRRKRVLSLVLCFALTGIMLTPMGANAAGTEKSFTVESTFEYDGKNINVKANISYLLVPENGAKINLTWQDAKDEGTLIKSIRLWIYKPDGTVVKDECYSKLQDLTSLTHSLPAGEYLFVTAVNLTDSITVGEGTAEGEFNSRLFFAQNGTQAMSENVWYSAAKATIEDNTETIVNMPLKRLLSELTINIEGLPEGTTFTSTVNNAAGGVYPSLKNADGEFGKADMGITKVEVPKMTVGQAKTSSTTIYLMPTCADGANTVLSVQIRFPIGFLNRFSMNGPIADIAGKYTLNIKYSDNMKLQSWSWDSNDD